MNAIATPPGTIDAEAIRAMPTYSWDIAKEGDTAAPFTFQVTEEVIRRYCEATRNTNPLYLDAAAAAAGPFGKLIAPPTIAFMVAPLRRNEVMHARGFASPEEKGEYQTPYAKCEIKLYRPIEVGEAILSLVYLAEKYERRGKKFINWQVKAVTGRGAPAFDYVYTTICPDGPTVGGAARPPAQPEPLPEIPAADALAPIIKLETQEAIDRYGELIRVRPRVGTNLHQDPEFAKRTIFGGTANSGPASLAYCSELVERAYGPAALLKPGARVEYKGIRPVRAGDEITLRGQVTERGPKAHQIDIWVHGQDGVLRGVGSATAIP
jgi:acyl dehydratase